MLKVYETGYHAVYLVNNLNSEEYDTQRGAKVPCHNINTQFKVVNTFLGGVLEVECANLTNAIFYANSYTNELDKIITGKREDLKGHFSKELQELQQAQSEAPAKDEGTE